MARVGDLDSRNRIRQMVCAFSVVEGMEDTILRKIPLVLFHCTADSDPEGHQFYAWLETFENLPTSRKEIIGENPRFCRYDDDDAISCIGSDEEVHLVLYSEILSSVSTRVFQLGVGHFHISLFTKSEASLLDFMDSFLSPKLLPRISCLTIVREDQDVEFLSRGTRQHIDDIPLFERVNLPLSVFGHAKLSSHSSTSHHH